MLYVHFKKNFSNKLLWRENKLTAAGRENRGDGHKQHTLWFLDFISVRLCKFLEKSGSVSLIGFAKIFSDFSWCKLKKIYEVKELILLPVDNKNLQVTEFFERLVLNKGK